MGGIEFILDEAVNDGALAYTLVANEHNFELDSVLFVGSITQLLVDFCAHAFKMNYNKSSDLYFLFRKHMQIYNIAKYENISDRIKRLASSSKPLPQASEAVSPKSIPRNFSNLFGKNQNNIPQLTTRLKYEPQESMEKVAVQQTEEKSEDNSMTFINELINLRQNRPNRVISRQKMGKNVKINENQAENEINPRAQRMMFRKTVQPKEIDDQEKSSLTKIKSQSTLKIDEILSNYNNYKQNKQQFLQTINKPNNTENHQRIVSQNLKEYFEDVSSPIEYKKRNFKEQAFGEIQNIWNQRQGEQDSVPKFQRSKIQKKDRFAELSQLLNNQLQQKPQVNPRLDILRQGKLILRRVQQKKENQQTQQLMKKNLVLSPRGLRVPGKICKNSDKSSGALPRYK